MATIIELDRMNEDFNGFHFAIQALSKAKTERRQHMTHLLIEDGRVIGTDGRRLHAFDPHSKYRAGIYRVVNAKKNKQDILLIRTCGRRSKQFVYPEYKQIFKEKDRAKELVGFKKEGNAGMHLSPVITPLLAAIHNIGGGFNIDFVKDLPNTEWTASIFKDNYSTSHVVFTDAAERMTAYVMAMRP